MTLMNPPPLGPFFLSWCQCCNICTAIKTTAALGVCKPEELPWS